MLFEWWQSQFNEYFKTIHHFLLFFCFPHEENNKWHYLLTKWISNWLLNKYCKLSFIKNIYSQFHPFQQNVPCQNLCILILVHIQFFWYEYQWFYGFCSKSNSTQDQSKCFQKTLHFFVTDVKIKQINIVRNIFGL